MTAWVPAPAEPRIPGVPNPACLRERGKEAAAPKPSSSPGSQPGASPCPGLVASTWVHYQSAGPGGPHTAVFRPIAGLFVCLPVQDKEPPFWFMVSDLVQKLIFLFLLAAHAQGANPPLASSLMGVGETGSERMNQLNSYQLFQNDQFNLWSPCHC